MPYGILRRAAVADVMALATEPGPIALYPALKVEPHEAGALFQGTPASLHTLVAAILQLEFLTAPEAGTGAQ